LGLGLVSLSLLVYGLVHVLKPLGAQYKMATRRGTLYACQPDDALNFLQEHIKPKGEVFIYPYYPMYYFLANVKNPTRHSILMYHINTKDQFREIIDILDNKKVKYVLLDTLMEGNTLRLYFPSYKIPHENELILEQYLKEHYRVVGIKNNFRIMVRRDLEENPSE
jgi:hypothetical protein